MLLINNQILIPDLKMKQAFFLPIYMAYMLSFAVKAQTTAVCGFSHKKVITIQGSQVVGGPHTDFPILIDHTDGTNLTTAAGKVTSAQGYDIIFADDNGDLLDFQLEDYNGGTGHIVAWVKIPTLTNGTDVDIHMLYGKATITTDQSSNATWSAGYHGVWHLNDDFNDGAGNGYTGTNNGSVDATGKIGDCQNFTDPNHWIELPTFPNMTSNFTLSAWIRTTDNSAPGQRVFCDDANNSNGGWALSVGDPGAGRPRFYSRGTGPTSLDGGNIIVNNTWHHIVAVADMTGTTKTIYLDGVSVASGGIGSAWLTDNGNAAIGGEVAAGESNNRFQGDIDEVRISSNALSGNWITTEYRAQNNPEGTFYTITAEIDNNYNSSGNGDWDDIGIWGGAAAVPHIGANVTIDQNVDVDDNSGDYIICNCDITSTGAIAVRLDMTDLRQLEILEDVNMTLTGGGTSTTAINLADFSQLSVGGDLTMSNSNTSADANLDIQLRDDSRLTINGNMTTSLSDGDDLYIDLNDNSSLSVLGDVTFNQSGGDETAFLIDDQSFVVISGDVSIDKSGGDDLRIQINNNSGSTGEFNVNGDFDIVHTGGDDIVFRLNNGAGTSSAFSIGGNFSLDKDAGDDFLIQVAGSSSLFTIVGSAVMDMTSTNDDDITIDSDDGDFNVGGILTLNRSNDAHEINFDMDGGNVTLGGLICNNSGTDDDDHSIWFSVDGSSILTVNGDVALNATGGNNIHIRANNNNGTDAQVDINGNLTIDQDGGSDIELRSAGTNSIFDISGTVVIDHDGGDDVEFRVDGTNATFNLNSTLTIDWNTGAGSVMEFDCNDGDMYVMGPIVAVRSSTAAFLEWDLDGGDFTTDNGMTLTSSGTLGGDEGIIFDVDEGSIFTCTGDVDITMTGGDDLRFDIDVNGGGSTSQVQIDGDLTIDRSDGDDIEFLVDDDNSIFHLTGNLSITSTGGEEILINLDNDATFDIDGNFTINHSNGLDGEIDLEFDAGAATPTFNVDGAMLINLTGGGDTYSLDINGGTFTIGQSLTLTNSGSGTTESIIVELDENVQMTIGTDMTMNLSGGDDNYIEIGNNSTSTAQLSVGGNLTLNHDGATGGDDMYIHFRDDTRGSVLGNLVLDGDFATADLLYIRLSTTSELDVSGNISFFAGATGKTELEVNDDAILRIAGNFLRTANPGLGILDCNNNATVVYNGSSAQIFAEDDGLGSDEFDYQNVIIQNTFGTSPQLTMEGLATIHGVLDLQDGIISSTNTDILVIDDDATVINASDDSHVDGWVRKIGNDVFTFPIGDAGRYRLMSITAPTGTTSQFDAQYNFTDPDPLYSTSSRAAGVHHVSRLEYWLLEETGPTSPTVTVTLSWDASSDVASGFESELIVTHFQGGQWIDEGNGGETIFGATGIIPSAGGISSFSPFTLASSTKNNPLPVTLTNFSATKIGESVELNWSTATEFNNDYFTVERSEDGNNWHEILSVEGAGTSITPLNYFDVDHNPYHGLSYYRLVQTDYDGTKTYSNIVSILSNVEEHQLVVYPVPADHSIHIEMTNLEDYQVEVYNLLGSRIDLKPLSAGNEISFNVSDLPVGVYVLVIYNQSETFERKIVIDR